MREWKEILLGEVIEVINGFAFKSSNFLESRIENSLPVLKIKNVANGDVHLNGCQFHQYDQALDKFVVTNGDVLLALTGNHPEVMTQVVGETSRYKLIERAFLNQRVAKVLPKDIRKLSNVFLYYFLKDDNTHDYLASQSTGSANQANISKVDIENIPITIPSLPEQTAISEVLSSLDDKIDLLHRQNKTLEQLAETLFRQWFLEQADESWERSTIGEKLVTVLGGTPSTTKAEFWDGDIPWINSGEVNRFRIDSPTKYITKLGLDKSNTKLLPKGTTVIAITGATLGQISLLEIDTCANQSVVGIIPNEELSKEFVFFWIKHKLSDILLNETGGAQPHINKNNVNEAELILPPKELLLDKIPLLADYFRKITNNINQIRTLTQLRDNLLPRLISGEVRINK